MRSIFGAERNRREESAVRPTAKPAGRSIPRIARLMALAIRFEGLLRDETIRDYAELARLGRVTRARMTQIMKLLDLAPDIQEQILFLPPIKGLNERNLRPIVSRIDWNEQRRLFQKIVNRFPCRPVFGPLEKLYLTCTRFRDLRLGLHEDYLDCVPRVRSVVIGIWSADHCPLVFFRGTQSGPGVCDLSPSDSQSV